MEVELRVRRAARWPLCGSTASTSLETRARLRTHGEQRSLGNRETAWANPPNKPTPEAPRPARRPSKVRLIATSGGFPARDHIERSELVQIRQVRFTMKVTRPVDSEGFRT
jgi:hypothetical protein